MSPQPYPTPQRIQINWPRFLIMQTTIPRCATSISHESPAMRSTFPRYTTSNADGISPIQITFLNQQFSLVQTTIPRCATSISHEAPSMSPTLSRCTKIIIHENAYHIPRRYRIPAMRTTFLRCIASQPCAQNFQDVLK